MVHVQRGEVCPTKPPGVSDDRAKSDRGAIPIVWTAPTAWRGAACCQPTELAVLQSGSPPDDDALGCGHGRGHQSPITNHLSLPCAIR
jgi:hypothetical protein